MPLDTLKIVYAYAYVKCLGMQMPETSFSFDRVKQLRLEFVQSVQFSGDKRRPCKHNAVPLFEHPRHPSLDTEWAGMSFQRRWAYCPDCQLLLYEKNDGKWRLRGDSPGIVQQAAQWSGRNDEAAGSAGPGAYYVTFSNADFHWRAIGPIDTFSKAQALRTDLKTQGGDKFAGHG